MFSRDMLLTLGRSYEWRLSVKQPVELCVINQTIFLVADYMTKLEKQEINHLYIIRIYDSSMSIIHVIACSLM